MRLTGNLSLLTIGRMLGFGTWIILYHSVSSTMCRNIEEETCIYFTYALLTTINRHRLYHRDQGNLQRRKENNWLLLSLLMKETAYVTRLMLHCKSSLSGWAQSGTNISQKNIISHPPHPAGHQHPGGAHLHGLQTGKDGINKVGKTTDGQSNGEWNNLELAF